MSEKLKISVVTVCYNAVKTIEETILSVVDQTYDNVEYIIIDGCSTDGTIDIIKKYAQGGSEYGKHHHSITYWISEPDKGIYDAMNKGIAVATGDYINFMNAGDTFVDDNTLMYFVRNIKSDSIISYGDFLSMYRGEKFLKKPLTFDYLKTKLPFCHQSTLIRLDYHKSHHYSLDYSICADYDFIYNAYFRDSVTFQYIPIPVSIFDTTDGKSSRNYFIAIREKFRVWGIDNDKIKQIPWYFGTMRQYISHSIRSILPETITIKIRKYLDSRRNHQ